MCAATTLLGITIEDAPIVHCFGEVRTCLAKPWAVTNELRAMLPEAFATAARAGIAVPGPGMSIYFTWGNEIRLTGGPMVTEVTHAPIGDGLGVRTVLGCWCVTAVHLGPYEGLKQAREAMFGWIGANGYEIRMPIVYIYENDPEKVKPENLRSKIYIPIVPRGSA